MIITSWSGMMEAQKTNLRQISALRPGNTLGQAVQVGLTEAHRYTVYITHVKSGALRASHRMLFQPVGNVARGMIYIDPSAGGFEFVNGERRHNPNKERPAQYGPTEHARGGDHAFYARTETEAGARINNLIQQVLRGAL